MKLYVIILSLLLQGCFWVSCVEASEADQIWKEAIGLARVHDNDFAYMDFQSILNDYPDSRYGMPAEFAAGEYFFLDNNLQMASDAFESFYTKYPHQQESLIALAYLYRIASVQDHADDMKKFRTMAASFRQLTFIFNDKKSFNYISGFQRKYKLDYYINKVDVYVNGTLFTEVPF